MGGINAGPWFGAAALLLCVAVPMLVLAHARFGHRRPSRDTGTPPERGSWTLSASTITKEPGTRTPATATTVGCSSSTPPGVVLGDRLVQTLPPLVSSFTGRGSSGAETVAHGVSGVQLGSAA